MEQLLLTLQSWGFFAGLAIAIAVILVMGHGVGTLVKSCQLY